MTRDLRRMADLTWMEFRDRLGSSLVVVPLGAIEQHGPHLPLDTDVLIPSALALDLADRLPVIVAPSFMYGYKSQPSTGGGITFPGTTSLDGATFTGCVRDIARDLGRQGARAVLFLNGNYENTYFAIEGADLAVRDLRDPAYKVLVVNWWELITAADLDEIFAGAFPGWEAEHAGVVETSLAMWADPSRVLPDRIGPTVSVPLPTYTVLPEPAGRVPASGVLRGAEGASPEIGAAMAARVLAALERAAASEFAWLALRSAR